MFRLVTDALATVDELADSGISLHVVDMDGEAISTPRNRKGSAKPLKTL